MKISVLIAIHNRRQKTVACIEALKIQAFQATYYTHKTELIIFDDASTDGSAQAVRELWPDARVLSGDGSYFWCKGMNVAWNEAAKGDPDYYLLLNDDTMMMPDALERLLKIAPTPESPINSNLNK